MIPEEDKFLERNPPKPIRCLHEWVDVVGSHGIMKSNHDISLIAFYCQKCLEIQVKRYNSSQWRLSKEFRQELDEEGEL